MGAFMSSSSESTTPLAILGAPRLNKALITFARVAESVEEALRLPG